jgi:hypothetical protein
MIKGSEWHHSDEALFAVARAGFVGPRKHDGMLIRSPRSLIVCRAIRCRQNGYVQFRAKLLKTKEIVQLVLQMLN